MIVFEVIQKTYRIIRNWSHTVARSKAIVQKTKQLTQNSGKLIAEIKADGLHFDDLKKLHEGWEKLLTEVETIANEVGSLGEKIKDETTTLRQEASQLTTQHPLPTSKT